MKSILGAALAVALIGISQSWAAPILDPADFTSLGNVTLTGPQTANTDTVTMGGVAGVLDDGIAVFDFDNFTLASGADLVATGSRPLAIVSRGDIDLLGTFDASALRSLILDASDEISILGNFEVGDRTSLEIDTSGRITSTSGGITLVPEPPSAPLFLLVATGVAWSRRLSREKASYLVPRSGSPS
jgi:hypothetical protein